MGGNADPAQNVSLDHNTDYGLFEASRIACPVLPQYHPKQLMELLTSGKIRRVKAILAHLVRYLLIFLVEFTFYDHYFSLTIHFSFSLLTFVILINI